MSFEWQTEEDFNWDLDPAVPEPPSPHRRWLWLVLAGVLLASTAVFLLYRQLNQRVEIATENVEADLLASYAILQRAAEQKDDNLFNSLLSGREPAWSIAQRNNLNAGLLFDRPGFDLTWQPGLVETAVLSQTLSPDLTAAELITLQNYSLEIGNGLTQTVQLKRADVYRLGADRWLLAPPEREFWGIRRRLEGQLISVRYPARDEDIVHRLAADLEAKLVQLCNIPGYQCPPDGRVRLTFSPEPDSLTQATFLHALTQDREAPGAIWHGEQAIVLPAPSLVGLPQDELGYRMLLRGYARLLLTMALNDLTNWECCANVPYYRAVVTRQLYELDVASWPLAANAASPTAVTLPNDFNLGDGALYWYAPFPEIPTDFAQTPAPYAVVDFLVNELHFTPSEVAAHLVNYKQFVFGQWLTDLAGSAWTEARLNDSFKRHVAAWQAQPAEEARPTADLLLVCRHNTTSQWGIYQYSFLQDDLQPLHSAGANAIFATGLPDGSGLAVSGLGSDGQPLSYLMRPGQDQITVTWNSVLGITSRPPLALPTVSGPNGRYLLWTIAPSYATDTFFGLTDVEACFGSGSCPADPLGGFPVWSPTGERLLTLTVINPWWNESASNGLMLLRQTPTSEVINSPGFGASPFWLDDENFGYISQFQNGVQQVMVTNTNLDRPQMVFSNEALRLGFPNEERPDSLTLQLVRPSPTDPRLFVILASDFAGEDTASYLLFFNRVSDIITRIVPLPDLFTEPGVRLSPDGRFLLIADGDTEKSSSVMLLFNPGVPQIRAIHLEGQTPYPRHFYASWSPDGAWLALPELGYIRLWHNGADEQLLNFDNLHCTNAVWNNRMEP